MLASPASSPVPRCSLTRLLSALPAVDPELLSWAAALPASTSLEAAWALCGRPWWLVDVAVQLAAGDASAKAPILQAAVAGVAVAVRQVGAPDYALRAFDALEHVCRDDDDWGRGDWWGAAAQVPRGLPASLRDEVSGAVDSLLSAWGDPQHSADWMLTGLDSSCEGAALTDALCAAVRALGGDVEEDSDAARAVADGVRAALPWNRIAAMRPALVREIEASAAVAQREAA